MKALRKLLFACATLAPVFSHATVNDIFPADFVPVPPETYVATTYLFDKTSSGPFASGAKTADWKIRSQSMVFRLAKFKDWDGTVVAGSVVGGVTQQALSGTGIPDAINRNAAGLRDIRFNGTAWLINRPESREYLATNLTWLLPTGQYNSGDAQNISDNRHQVAFTTAWIKGIGARWNLELIGEIAAYTDNTSFFPGGVTQSKHPSHALTSYLRYDWGKGLETYVGYERNWGGSTKLNDVAQHDPMNLDRPMVGLIYQPNPKNILNLRVLRDIRVANGFGADHEVVVRWLNFF